MSDYYQLHKDKWKAYWKRNYAKNGWKYRKTALAKNKKLYRTDTTYRESRKRYSREQYRQAKVAQPDYNHQNRVVCKNKNPQKFTFQERERGKRYNAKLRKLVLAHYAHGDIKCVRCGSANINALSLDHLNSDGYLFKKHKISKSALWAKMHDFPPIFQVLCMNCQYRKRREKGEWGKVIGARRAYSEKHSMQLKKDVLSNYSTSIECKWCGENDIVVLTLDHVNGDGKKDREQYGNGIALYRHLKKSGYPDAAKYQVLCASCNQIKKYVNHEH